MPKTFAQLTGPKRRCCSSDNAGPRRMKPSVLPITGSPTSPITGDSPEPAGGSASGCATPRAEGNTSEHPSHHGVLPPRVRRVQQRRVDRPGGAAQHRPPVAERLEAGSAVVGAVPALADAAERQPRHQEVTDRVVDAD